MALPASIKTPSRAALLKAAAAKSGGQGFLKYAAQAKKPQQQTATDPFAQMGQAEQDALIRRTIGVMPSLTSPAQQQSQVNALLDPVVRQITAKIQGQTAGGLAAVQGITKNLAADLAASGQQNVRNSFAPAEAGTAAANAALSDRLTGVGTQNSDALAARLASINAPDAVDPAVAALRQAATGAGNATYATGNASLEQMLAQHGNAAAYANKLPDIARLTGIQQAGAVEGHASKDLADQLSPVYGQIPTLVQNIRNADQGKVDNFTDNKRQLVEWLGGQNTSRAVAKAGLTADTAKANAPQRFTSGGGIYEYNPATQTYTTIKAPPAPKPAAPRSVSPGSTLVDPNTGKIIYKAPPKPAKAKAKTADTGGKSDSENRQAYDGAVKVAQSGHGHDVLGKEVGGKTFQQTYNSVLSYLTGLGYAGAGAKRKALQAMGAAGWTVPGQVDVQP